MKNHALDRGPEGAVHNGRAQGIGIVVVNVECERERVRENLQSGYEEATALLAEVPQRSVSYEQ